MLSHLAVTAGTLATLWMTPAPEALSIPMEEWQPMVGDRLVADTTENIGYLIHSDNSAYLTFPIVTGQQRVVHYIGKTYNATTPNWHWVVKTDHILSDRITFGPTGRFLRMYKDGKSYTSYGIHEHRDEEYMFALDPRYESMGCVIVQTAIMDLIEDTYRRNGKTLDVVTTEKFAIESIKPGEL